MDRQEELLEEQIELYTMIKFQVFGQDYKDPKLQASYRKLRHHLDQMILRMESLKG